MFLLNEQQNLIVKMDEDVLFCDNDIYIEDAEVVQINEEYIGDEDLDSYVYDDDDDGEPYYYDSSEIYHQKTSFVYRTSNSCNPQAVSKTKESYQPSIGLFRKISHKINIDKYEGPRISLAANNSLAQSQKNIDKNRIRMKDKHDRATAEQVLDSRTLMILYKLVKIRFFDQMDGCISTGKEANVYHALTKDDKELAIKIFKTSILVFKDRDKYMSGEYRFRHGYCRHNPRKMVASWAEKEFRNLNRMHKVGLNVPVPLYVRSHVMVMSFIGSEGWPAPVLKDVNLTQSQAREVYRDVVIMMWKMYNLCKLVHADLSEFNMLYLDELVYIIDVSQSVEHDHPCAFEFLKKDCTNITDYFKKKNVATMTVKQLFDFITDPNITEISMETVLEGLSKEARRNQKRESNPTNQVYRCLNLIQLRMFYVIFVSG